MRVGRQVAEVYTTRGVPRGEAYERSRAMLRKVQIADPDSVMERFSHQLSGGMAAARRDRDGARRRPVAADPGRADDRPRRDGRGRGARPDRGAPGRAAHLRAVHQPQPRRDLEDVRPARRPVRRPPRRGGPDPAGAGRPAPPVHGRPAALRPAARARARTTAGSTRSRASCRRSAPTCRAACSPIAARSSRTSAGRASRR